MIRGSRHKNWFANVNEEENARAQRGLCSRTPMPPRPRSDGETIKLLKDVHRAVQERKKVSAK